MMSKRKGKDGIILIVEGTSDQTALEGYIESVFPDCRIMTGVVGFDPTSGLDENKKPIPNYSPKKEAARVALQVMVLNGWGPDNVKTIIQVTDTDGAYVDESYVVEDATIEGKYLCTEGKLLSKEPNKIIFRNKCKKRYTLELLGQSRLRENGWDIDYRLFFMSTNLEHVTQGISKRLSLAKKNDLAQKLRNRCFEDSGYASQLFASQALSGKTFDQSWNYIMSDGHSLERQTNLGLLSAEN